MTKTGAKYKETAIIIIDRTKLIFVLKKNRGKMIL
jgi:hypothetical protein